MSIDYGPVTSALEDRHRDREWVSLTRWPARFVWFDDHWQTRPCIESENHFPWHPINPVKELGPYMEAIHYRATRGG